MAIKTSTHQMLSWTLGAAVTAAAFWAGSATAEADKLDTANAKLTEALQALKEAAPRGDPAAFEGHRDKAVGLLTRAQGEILKAKRLAAQN